MPRVRIRHVAICVAIVVWICYFLPADQGVQFQQGTNHDATVLLARYMNDASLVRPIRARPSSFDWNSVNFTYPLSRKPSLPAPFKNRPRIQHRLRSESQEERRLAVKKVFKKSWASYRSKAWMKDALKPISGQYVDQFSGWAATLVDSLDTLWMLGMRNEFYEAVEAVATIDFGMSTAPTVNTFETCIRYLGGLLAAYDLSGHEVLKAKAIEVGDLLYGAFNTKNGMPVDFINFENAKQGFTEDVIKFYSYMTTICTDRRFAVTNEGRSCLVPATTKIGDEVLAFNSLDIPFIVRRWCSRSIAESINSDQNVKQEVYRLVGSAYVHGVMDGELLSDGKQDSSSYAEEKIWLG